MKPRKKHKSNTGILYQNVLKSEDNHPDLIGTIDIYGIPHSFCGWMKENEKGGFIKTAFKPHEMMSTEEQKQLNEVIEPFKKIGERWT